MVFGFKDRQGQTPNSLSEEEIRKRLYGSSIGVATDSHDKQLSKKTKPSGGVTKIAKSELKDERLKIKQELISLKRELEQTKRKLSRMRNLKAKKVRLLIFSVAALFVLIMIAVFIMRHTFKSAEQPIKTKSTPLTSPAEARYTIQAAVYENSDDAENFSADLKSKGYESFVYKSSRISDKYKFIVCVGAFVDKKSAAGVLDRIKTKEGIKDSFITQMPR
jgi:cell division protein FtsN